MIKSILLQILRIPAAIYNKYVFIRRKPVLLGDPPRINGRIYMVSDPGAVTFGRNVRINSSFTSNPIGGSIRSVLFAEPGATIKIGDRTGISNTAIHAALSVVIGNDAVIGGDCRIYDTDFHSIHFEERICSQGTKVQSVEIGNGVFIGAGCCILKGVHIGEKSVIAAGSVVTGDVPAGEIWGGCPARFIRKLDSR